MDAEACFDGLGQSILIKCKSDEKMSSIFQSFAKEIKYRSCKKVENNEMPYMHM